MSGAPARGTAPRRPRRQHHRHNHNNNREDERSHDLTGNHVDKGRSKVNEEERPKVNPIFLWALQREQRIIEVRCEDYDKRNRIKLTKTARGWRSIPRTASNVYAASLAANGHTCVDRICESPATGAGLSSATSSPNSSRWSPATISSSNLAPWSISSTRSNSSSSHLAAISSPSREGGETGRENGVGDSSSIASRSRNQSDGESINDFEDSCSRSTPSLRRMGTSCRKGQRSEVIRTCESDKRRKHSSRETRAAIVRTWNDRTDNNQNNSEEDSTNGLTDIEEMSLGRTVVRGKGHGNGKKRRRERNVDMEKRKKHRRSSESLDASGLSVMSSPRSWERLMNGTRFLNSGPVVDQSRVVRDHEEEVEKVEEGEMDECEEYDPIRPSAVRPNRFGSIDLERVKRDQHLQPRVVLEQLRLSGTLDTGVRALTSIVYENDVEKEEMAEDMEQAGEKDDECNHKEIDPQDRVRKETGSTPDKSEIRDILSMLDSTGSPVLATDTPTAHLPSCHDSTRTNISSCYENRDSRKVSHRRSRDKLEKLRLLPVSSPTVGRSTAKTYVPPDLSAGRLSEFLNRDTSARFNVRTGVRVKNSESPSNERERIRNGKSQRRENPSEAVDSSSSELGTSSEILEALRCTPGLSISVTTRLNGSDTHHEMSELASRNSHKRPTSALLLDKLLPTSPHRPQKTATSTACCSSSEVTCSQDSTSELTLESILATPAKPSDRLNGPGLATIVSRLSNRTDKNRGLPESTGRRLDQRTKNMNLGCLNSDTAIAENRTKQNGDISRLSRIPDKIAQPTQPNHHNHKRRDNQHNNLRHNNRSSTKKALPRMAPPAEQLRRLMDDSSVPIPDPLLVPRDCLPALAAAPAVEIPKLLTARPELRLPEALTRPDLLRDPDLLVISLAHLQQVLDQGDGSVCEYTYRPPHPLALGEDDDEEFGEEDELVEEEDEEEEDENEVEEDDEEEDEDQDVPEQSLDLHRKESLDVARVRGMPPDERRKNQRVPPKLISCKPIGTLMPGPIDLSRNCSIRSIHPTRSGQTFAPASRQSDISTTQLPPPPLLRVRSGLLKQESEVTSTGIPSPCIQDDAHLWHPLFGSQKRQMQQQHQQQQLQLQQQQQQQQQQQKQQEQQTHRTPWHRTTLAS